MNVAKPCTHLAGEYFVAAELSKLGYNVAMTVGNAKKVDIIVELDEQTVPIQVKAIANKKSVGWPIKVGAEFGRDLIFVCVVLNGEGVPPTYYVLDGTAVNKRVKTYSTRAILNIYSVGEYQNNWALIAKRLSLKKTAA